MQKAETRQALKKPGAFEKFVAAEKSATPGVARLINGFGESTLFNKFAY